MENDGDVSMSIRKTSGWSRLQISFHGSKHVTKDGSYLRDMIIMDSVTTINLFGNPSVVTNRQKAEMRMNFLINSGSK